jgi:DNA-binding NarL/FixJ family response regulator
MGWKPLRRPDQFDRIWHFMDVSMPRMDGIAATRIIRQEMPEAEVIVISQNDPKVVARQARDVNARGYVSKSELGHSLLPMIRSLVEEKQGYSQDASFVCNKGT